MTTQNQANPFSIQHANIQILNNVSYFLKYFSIPAIEYKNRFAFTCPVHNSDGSESAAIFKQGEKHNGNFRCWTRHCESEIGYTVYDLFKYLLKKKRM